MYGWSSRQGRLFPRQRGTWVRGFQYCATITCRRLYRRAGPERTCPACRAQGKEGERGA